MHSGIVPGNQRDITRQKRPFRQSALNDVGPLRGCHSGKPVWTRKRSADKKGYPQYTVVSMRLWTVHATCFLRATQHDGGTPLSGERAKFTAVASSLPWKEWI